MIFKYSDFVNPNVLHLFDFDNTLVFTPNYNDLVIDYLNESIDELVDMSLNFIKADKDMLKTQDGRVFIEDPNHNINIKGNWVRKKDRVYMVEPHKYLNNEISKPKRASRLKKFYNIAENKCIVTARPESSRSLVESSLNELGFDDPIELYMLPKEAKNQRKWKAEKIKSIMEKGEFKGYRFYDDKSKIVKEVDKMVKNYFPNIDYKSYRIKL